MLRKIRLNIILLAESISLPFDSPASERARTFFFAFAQPLFPIICSPELSDLLQLFLKLPSPVLLLLLPGCLLLTRLSLLTVSVLCPCLLARGWAII